LDPQLARAFLTALAEAFVGVSVSDATGESLNAQMAVRQSSLIHRYLPLFQRYLPEATDPLLRVLGRNEAAIPDAFQNKLDTATSESSVDPIDAIVRNAEQETNPTLRDKLFSEAAMMAADRSGIDRARQIVQRIHDANFREEVGQRVTVIASMAFIENLDWVRFRGLIGQVKDPLTRSSLLTSAGRKLIEKSDPEQAVLFLNDSLAVLGPLPASDDKVLRQLVLASAMVGADRTRAYDLAQMAVTTLNQLHQKAEKEKGKGDAPLSAITTGALRRQLESCFSTLGRADFDRALYVAMQLQNLEQRVIAEAVSCREALLVHEARTPLVKQN
jgi:hypothetical protein